MNSALWSYLGVAISEIGHHGKSLLLYLASMKQVRQDSRPEKNCFRGGTEHSLLGQDVRGELRSCTQSHLSSQIMAVITVSFL